MDRPSQNLRRGHSRKALSSSVLPAGPELDPFRRRSGIRHFSQVDSTYDGKAGAGAVKKPKFRSVSAFTEPMKWRKLLGKTDKTAGKAILNCENVIPGIPGILENPVVKEQRALQTLQNLQPGQDPSQLLRRRVSPGQGYMMVPDSSMQYPYPQHIPAAATHAFPPRHQIDAASPMTPVGYLVPAPNNPICAPHASTPISMEKIMYIASGIGLAIAVLFTWIFRFEVIKYGGIASIMVFLWKLGQWQSQLSLHIHQHKKASAIPAAPAPQRYIISPQPVPGGW